MVPIDFNLLNKVFRFKQSSWMIFLNSHITRLKQNCCTADLFVELFIIFSFTVFVAFSSVLILKKVDWLN